MSFICARCYAEFPGNGFGMIPKCNVCMQSEIIQQQAEDVRSAARTSSWDSDNNRVELSRRRFEVERDKFITSSLAEGVSMEDINDAINKLEQSVLRTQITNITPVAVTTPPVNTYTPRINVIGIITWAILGGGSFAMIGFLFQCDFVTSFLLGAAIFGIVSLCNEIRDMPY